MVALFSTCYGIIVTCSLRIRRYVASMNKLRMRDYNQQVSSVLLFQVSFFASFFY
jgi:hypothetical protein